MDATIATPPSVVRRLTAAALVAIVAVAAAPICAGAEPVPNRYSRAWTSAHGLKGSQVWTTVQDRAGYLWLGTNEGLVRFDGVGFLVIREFEGLALPGGSVRALSLGRDGALWIGFGATGSVSRVAGGRPRNYSNSDGLPGSNILAVVEDRTGTAWAGSLLGLYRLEGERWQSVPASEGVPPERVSAIVEDSRGDLWVGTDVGTFRRRAGTSDFVLVSPLASVDIKEDTRGVVWGVGADGLVRFDIGLVRTDLVGTRLHHDRDGTMWVGTLGSGLLHLDMSRPQPVVHRYRGHSSLTSDLVHAVRQDREGNIWVGTQSGLNRLSEAVVSMLDLGQDVGQVRAVARTNDGTLWTATSLGLVRTGSGPPRTYGVADGLPSASVRALHHDPRSGLWVATTRGIARLVGTRFVPITVAGPPLHQAMAMTMDGRGDHWVGDIDAGVVRIRDGGASVMFDAASGRKSPFSIYGDSHGRVWAGFFDGTLMMFDVGTTKTFGPGEGLIGGMVTSLHESPPGTLWIGSSKGLSRYRDGVFTQVTWANGLPGNLIGAIVPDTLGHLWLGTSSGIVRVDVTEIERGLTDPDYQVRHVLYDASDGLRGDPIGFGAPTSVHAANGAVWFVTSDGVAMMDVHRAAKNRQPPSVFIESVVADTLATGVHEAAPLPPRTGHLQISYAALSLRAPEKLRFRYMLEGFDSQWVEAGPRRQAFYTNLAPGSYRFRVLADNDGVPSDGEALWAFSIAPAFYQTRWFAGLLIAALIGAATMAWRVRVQQVRSQFSLILVERSRMAREIHDTLLQSLLGVMLRLDEVERTVGESAEGARQQLGRLRQQLEFYIREARQSIRDLRSPLLQTRDLVTALEETGERLTAGRAEYTFSAAGPARRAPLRVEEHVLRITQEAIANAIRHGAPTHVSVAVTYAPESLSVRVADDGLGFDAAAAGPADGHWGISSMQERAAQIEARFELQSTPGRGTAIELHVPLHA